MKGGELKDTIKNASLMLHRGWVSGALDLLDGAETTTATGVYVASRASVPERSAMWREMRSKGAVITSSWIDEAGPGETASFAELWLRIEREISHSIGLVLYAETEDFPLKGALVEVGMAIGFGLPIAVVIPGVTLEPKSMKPLGSWAAHPNVSIFSNVNSAFQHLCKESK